MTKNMMFLCMMLYDILISKKSIDKVGSTLDKFSYVFEQPSIPHMRVIQHSIELLDLTQPIPNHKQYWLSQTELDEAK